MSQTTSSTGADRPDEQHARATTGTSPRATKPTSTTPTAPTPEEAARRRRPTGLIIALGVAVAVIAALVAVVLWQDEGDDVTTEPTTTEAPATTATSAPSTTQATEPSTTTAPPAAPVDTSTAVFPDASGARFYDPEDAARAFAVDFVGFTDPLVGEFMQGDARSGEVEVRPMADGPATTVFVRQLGTDGSWWVLGSATANITTDAPGPGDAITSPVTVSGSAVAFEGTVAVEVRQDGAREAIGTGIVTGGGDVPRPFSGQISFSSPTADHGALVFLTRSEQDGRVWEAGVIRVRFA
jgi:hypothetical protein